jgi:hypothetical protein
MIDAWALEGTVEPNRVKIPPPNQGGIHCNSINRSIVSSCRSQDPFFKIFMPTQKEPTVVKQRGTLCNIINELLK